MGQAQDHTKHLQITSVSVSALSDHLMGPALAVRCGGQSDVSVSALSDHLMGQNLCIRTNLTLASFSIRSFGSFDGTLICLSWQSDYFKFQYPLFRII